jgi:hypothetical protein
VRGTARSPSAEIAEGQKLKKLRKLVTRKPPQDRRYAAATKPPHVGKVMLSRYTKLDKLEPALFCGGIVDMDSRH